MRYLHRTIAIGASLLMAGTGQALAPPSSLAGLYMRARAAEAAGDSAMASAAFASLLAAEPGNVTIAVKAYRQAISAGDLALATRAANQLDAQGAPPPDARILLALEKVRAHDWAKARVATEALGQDRVFGFLAPYFRAWIAQGSGQGDALAWLDGAIALPLAVPYHDEQRAFLLLATGHAPEARPAAGSALRLPAAIDGPEQALSLLLIHVGSDLQHQQIVPIGLIMVRLGTYAAPDVAAGWLVLADMLRSMKRPDLAIAALDRVDASDPLIAKARAMRIVLLNDAGRSDAALAAALAATRRAGADVEDWGRLADLYSATDHHADAATAYGAAIQAAQGSSAPANMIWPLLLQQGAAFSLAGDWPRAKAAMERAYVLAPDQAVVLNQLGYSQIEHHDDVQRAAELIAQANKLEPGNAAITDSLGWVTYLRGSPAGAVPLLERAAAGDPGEPTINEHLGDVYWAVGRQYEARYAWRAALVTADEKDRSRLSSKIDVGPSRATAAP